MNTLSCDDGNECTVGDRCTSGTCGGSAFACGGTTTCAEESILSSGTALSSCLADVEPIYVNNVVDEVECTVPDECGAAADGCDITGHIASATSIVSSWSTGQPNRVRVSLSMDAFRSSFLRGGCVYELSLGEGATIDGTVDVDFRNDATCGGDFGHRITASLVADGPIEIDDYYALDPDFMSGCASTVSGTPVEFRRQILAAIAKRYIESSDFACGSCTNCSSGIGCTL